MTSTLIEKMESRKADRLAAYAQLVVQVCNGDELDPDEAESILDAVGKSAADLETDVSARQRIIDLHAAIAAGEKLKPDRDRLVAQIADAGQTLELARLSFERAQRLHAEKLMAIHAQIADVDRQMSPASSAHDELLDLAKAKPEFKVKVAAIQKQIAAIAVEMDTIDGKKKELQRLAKHCELRSAAYLEDAVSSMIRADEQRFRRDAATASSKRDECLAQMESLQAKYLQLQAQRVALHQETIPTIEPL